MDRDATEATADPLREAGATGGPATARPLPRWIDRPLGMLLRMSMPDPAATRVQREALAVTMLIMLGSSAIFVPALLLLGDPVGAFAALLALPASGIVPILLRRGCSVSLAWHYQGCVNFALLAFFALHQGGIAAPAVWWLILVPSGQVVSGRRVATMVWAVVCALFVLALTVAQLMGIPLPAHMGIHPGVLIALTISGFFGAMLCFLYLMQRSQQLAMAALAVARDQALVAEGVKSDFLANMSHELRTPLNGILGTAELLSATSLTGEQSRLVQVLVTSGRGLLDLLTDVIDLARARDGQASMARESFHPGTLVEGIVEALAAKAATKGLRLVCHVDPSLPASVIGDAKRLRQMLLELVGNAVKFTDAGEVLVEVGREEGGEGNGVAFSVTDTGVGIGEAHLLRLRRPFERVDTATTRRTGGAGIGLALVQEFARLMGGRVTLESTLGAGTRARLVVPLGPGAAPGDTTVEGTPPATTILVVESHALSRRALQGRLAAMGATVRCERLESLLDPAFVGCCDGPAAVIVSGFDCGPAQLEMLRGAASRWRTPVRAIGVYGGPGASDADKSGNGPAIIRLPAPLTTRPLAAFLERVRQGNDGRETATGNRSEHRWRVLLADDNPVNCQIATAMLLQMQCDVDVVQDGVAAVERWERETYDIIFMDWHMPEMDGLEATRTIRAREVFLAGRKRVPIVALTANAEAGDREHCLAAGMDDHIGKPLRRSDLQLALRRWAGSASDADAQSALTAAHA